VEWSEPCWPVWGSLDGEVGSIFGCDRIFYEIWGLVLWSGMGDSNSMLLHDPVPLDTHLCVRMCVTSVCVHVCV